MRSALCAIYWAMNSSHANHADMPVDALRGAFSLESAVWLDGRNWHSGGTGVHSYTHGLKEALSSQGVATRVLLGDRQSAGNNLTARLANFRTALFPRQSELIVGEAGGHVRLSDIYRRAHTRFRLTRRLTRLSVPSAIVPPQIMHWTSPLPLKLEGALNVVTIHDVIPLTHPELTGIDPRRFRKLVARLLQVVDGVATVSETARHDILAHFDVAPELVHNIYQPVAFDAALEADMRGALPVAPDGSYVFMGRVEARKNIDRLLEAHALSGTVRPLVIIGPPGDDDPDCTPRGASSRVIRVPWCERERLLRTLAGAHALLFPSLAEGFGLPIIEAMRLGTPVLTARGGATGEIAGDDAILVDPLDVRSIAGGISHLDAMSADSPLRQDLVVRGRRRAALFSQEAFIGRLTAFYRSVLRASG